MKQISNLLGLMTICSNWPALIIKKFFPHFTYPKLIKMRNGTNFVITKYLGRAELSILLEIWYRKVYDTEFIGEIQSTDLVLDVGANKGYFSLYAASKTKAGTVYAFEPHKPLFDTLLENIKLNSRGNIKSFNFGLWDKSGEVPFYTSGNVGGHSMYAKPNKVGETKVIAKTLSDFCLENNITTIDFLKLDCEGAEYNIILHLDVQTLGKIKRIAMETHDFYDFKQQQLVNFLKTHNFEVQTKGDYVYAKRID